MPKWTYHITVYNETDLKLTLDESNLAWGKKEGGSDNFPDSIMPGQSGKYNMYSPAARSEGIEFYLLFKSKATEEKKSYGTLKINVDIPYYSSTNTSSCTTTGVLHVTGFEQIPNKSHDFSTSVTISKGVSGE